MSAYVDYDPWLTDSVGVEEVGFAYKVAPRIQVMPNPFRNRVIISFEPSADVEINIYDVSGRLIRSFGEHIDADYVIWDGRDAKGLKVSSGLYLLCVSSKDFIRRGKILLLR